MRKYYEEDWFDKALRSDDESTSSVGDEEEDDETLDGAFTFRIGRSPMATPQSSDAQWYPRSQTVEVHGYRINGMVYVGTRLSAVNGQGAEPALVNPLLPVHRSSFSYAALDLPYWPNYGSLSPRARGRYLRWLAEGRKDPEIGIGFVFLFFYGLERRLLADDCPEEEQAEIMEEIETLRGVYGKHPAFHSYAFRLLDFWRAILGSCLML
jgi:TerB N-terminal domain